MKTHLRNVLRLARLVVLVLLSTLNSQLSTLFSQGTAFTYSGRLSDQGAPANGMYDMQFAIFDNSILGNPIGNALTTDAITVSNGLFSVTLDFDTGVFTGAERWLEIAVRTNGSPDVPTPLVPRQLITATPYAIYAGGVTASGISGTIASENIGEGSLTTVMLAAGAVGSNQLAGGAVTAAKLDPTIGVWTRSGENVIRPAGNVGIGTANPIARLDVAGNVGYSGQLTKLDVAEQSAAYVRAYDLWFGHPSRHGSQGRALVDLGNFLALNYDRDWPGLYLFGQVVLDPFGQNTNGTLSGGLIFGGNGSGEGILSKRGAGGNQYGLDFYTAFQPRMTIANNGNVGIGTNNPQSALHVAGTVRWAAASELSLDQDGSIELGNSFGNATVPYIDFHYGVGAHEDYNVRLINSASNQLTVEGGLRVTGALAASQITGTIAASNIAAGTITSTSLAPGAAAANLNAAGQSGVASGGLVLSATENAALVNAGYVRIGGMMTTAEAWQQRVNLPFTGLASHSAVWTGNEMIVWGGTNGANNVNDGGRYNPTANSWTPVSTIEAPGARQLHTAVWTGNKMIVWGGYNGARLNDGGRYNPAGNSWTPVSSAQGPTARSQHTAVWTGNEMIVWGGYNGTRLNDGGRYNPETDNWTPVSTTGAPTARRGHTAVWTGSEMIVWGGDGGDLDPGGRYNPAANSWTPVSTTGTPDGRRAHTAVWTGSEMIVWGGFNEGTSIGGRYSPAGNSWTTMSTSGAPAVRVLHTAVWTGSEMIVWGGGVPDAFNDGGRYNPAGNSWTAVSMAGAPGARYLHTAVWTGNEMIISGGYNPGGSAQFRYLNDTFTYTPGHALYLYQRP